METRAMRNRVILKEMAEAARQADAKQLRSAFFEDCRSLVEELDGDISGYALVAWTPHGELRSVYHTGRGPIRPAVVPALVQDALNRHVAQDMAVPIRLGESE
jgi:hypothetical protein